MTGDNTPDEAETPSEFVARAAQLGAFTLGLLDSGDVAEWAESFASSTELVMLMRVARRWGRPLSDVLDDARLREAAAAEIGFDLFEAADAERRCQRCGTTPEEWRDADGRKRGVEPVWVFETVTCDGCLEREKAEKAAKIPDEQRAYTEIVMTRNPALGDGPDD